MNAKLLLILSLVVPSLCIGKTVKITVTETVPDSIASTSVEVEMTGEKLFKVEFSTKRNPHTPANSSYIEMFIEVQENKNQILKFLEFCDLHFPVDFAEKSKLFFEGKTSLMSYNFSSFFESLLIQNNFAITYKEEDERNNLINGHTIFFYKPD